MVQGVNSSGSPNCLESAISPAPAGPYSVVGEYCDSDLSKADLDPSIYQAGDGSAQLLFSRQDPNTNYSTIAVAQLSQDGTSINNTAMYVVADMSNVQSALPGVHFGGFHTSTAATGGKPENPELENPQLNLDNAGTTAADGTAVAFDLFASFGSYNGNNSSFGDNGNGGDGTYHTVQIACENITGPCFDNNPSLVDPQLLANETPFNLMNPGGLCLAYAANGIFALFASPVNGTTPDSSGPRGLFFEPTTRTTGIFGSLTSPTQQGPFTPPQFTQSA